MNSELVLSGQNLLPITNSGHQILPEIGLQKSMSDNDLTALAIGGGAIAALWLISVMQRFIARHEIRRELHNWRVAGFIQPRDKRGRFRAR